MSYVRILTTVQDGQLSDYSGASTDLFEEEFTGQRVQEHTLSLTVAGSTRTLYFTDFATVSAVIVNNQSTADSVTVACQNAAAAAVSQSVAYGETLKLCDVKQSANMTLLAVTSTQTVQVIIIGT